MSEQRAFGPFILFICMALAVVPGGMAQDNATVQGSPSDDGISSSTSTGTIPTADEFFSGRSSLSRGDIAVHFKRLGNASKQPEASDTGSEQPATSQASEEGATGQAGTPYAVSNASLETTPQTVSEVSNGTLQNTTSGVLPETATGLVASANASSDLQGLITPDNLSNATTGTTPQENLSLNKNASTSALMASATGNITITGNVSEMGNVSALGNVSTAANLSAMAPGVEENVSPVGAVVVEEEAEEEYLGMEDRIWDETKDQPMPYTWTPQTFAGFFYDMDEDVGTETLTLDLDGSEGSYSRSVDEGNLIYRSDVSDIEYKFDDWGSYQVIGFLANKYFAGYKGTTVTDRESSLINENQLRQVLMDSDDDQTITTGSVLPMEEGYELRIKEIDINGNKVWLALARDGDEIDSKVITPGDTKSATYTYEIEIGGRDVPMIMAHVANVFAGAESSLVTVDGIFQLSDNYASVEDGDTYGEMEVVSVSDSAIEMENKDSFTLRRGKIVNIMGDVGFVVADADVLRLAPIVDRSGEDQWVRGTIVNPEKLQEEGRDSFDWTPYNFEGFYYDIDDDVGSESLSVVLSGEKISDGDLQYITRPQSVGFEFEPWGGYDVIGFMADKYFAGFDNTTEFTDPFSTINEGELRKVLMDSDQEETVTTGSVLPLENGYELGIKEVDINGNKVWMAISKDGDELANKVLTPAPDDVKGSTFVYEVKIGSEDVPILAVHLSNVFRGKEADLATVDGIFQVSDDPESVEEGEEHGKMKVESLSDQGVEMVNDGSISLGRGKEIEIMGDLKFRVADSDTRIFCPIAFKPGTTEPLRLNLSQATANKTTIIEVTSGKLPISGARVIIDGQDVGSTDEEGLLRHMPTTAGTFQVQAKLRGYKDGNGSLTVVTEAESRRMVLNVPPEVIKGESFVITVRGGSSMLALEDVNLELDGQELGQTDSQGSLRASINETGKHEITADKEGFDRVSRIVSVISPLEVLSLNVSENPVAGQDMEVKVAIRNSGSVPDNRTLSLKVNGNDSGTEEAVVGPGDTEEVTFTYRPENPGQYTFGIENLERTVEVQEPQSNLMLFLALGILLVILGAGAYLYKTGEMDNLRKRLQGR